MIGSDHNSKIAERLFRENICQRPLDERSLGIIAEYMRYDRSSGDLCRRLSDVELNYDQISSESEEACQSASESTEIIASALRKMTDGWKQAGHLREFIFDQNAKDILTVKADFSDSIELVCVNIDRIADRRLIIAETAAQIRACAASFSEIYKEAELAIYAATLVKDVDDILDCRATAMQAHAAIRECEKASADLLRVSRVCSEAITRLHGMILEASSVLGLNETGIPNRGISVIRASNIIGKTISDLENLNFAI